MRDPQPGTDVDTSVNEESRLDRAKSHIGSAIRSQVRVFRGERLGQIGVVILLLYISVALFAPALAPYDPDRKHHHEDGSLIRLEPPSEKHPLGTTSFGRDILSQVIISSRISLIVGTIAALFSVLLGTSVGIVTAYYGGRIDDLLMRITDLAFGIPFIPFVIVLIIFLNPGLFNMIFAISIIMWRGPARVIRSQALTVKERPYLESAHAVGASDIRIMAYHIFPNVLPLSMLYGAFAIAWAILAEATISFLGLGAPNQISWGKMIFRAYTVGAIRDGLWWVVPAGLAINFLVISVFLVARTYEKVANPDLELQR